MHNNFVHLEEDIMDNSINEDYKDGKNRDSINSVDTTCSFDEYPDLSDNFVSYNKIVIKVENINENTIGF